MIPYIISRNPDPFNIIWSGDWVVASHLWLGLVEFNHAGEIEGRIASSWTQSLDGLTWEFHLRDNLRWSDGTEMTMRDIVESLNASRLGTSHTSLARAIDKIEYLDQVVRFRLNRRVPSLLIALSYVDWAIVHPNAIRTEKGRAAVKAIPPYSGYYSLVEYQGASAMSPKSVNLRLNDSSIEKSLGVDLALPKFAEISNFSDCAELVKASERILTFRAYGQTMTNECMAKLKLSGFRIQPTAPTWIHKLDVTIRGQRSLSVGVRRRLIVDLHQELKSIANKIGFGISTGIRPTDTFGSLTPFEFNQFLKESSKSKEEMDYSALQMRIVTMRQWSDWLSFQWVVNWFRSHRVDLTVSILEKESYWQAIRDGSIHKDYDMNYLPLGAGDPDPDSSWRMYQSASSVKVISVQQLDEAYFEPDRQKRETLYKQFSRRLIESAVMIPLVLSSDLVGMHKSVRGSRSPTHRMGLSIFDVIR